MPEFRQNMVSKEWVIIATERAKRPDNFINTTLPDQCAEFLRGAQIQ